MLLDIVNILFIVLLTPDSQYSWHLFGMLAYGPSVILRPLCKKGSFTLSLTQCYLVSVPQS